MDMQGIITYNACHLRTEQALLRLIGKYDVRVYAIPYIQRPVRTVLFQHRPNQSAATGKPVKLPLKDVASTDFMSHFLGDEVANICKVSNNNAYK